MIDISSKISTPRSAVARAVVHLDPPNIERIRRGDVPKGNPLEAARIAAVQSAKKTADIIPYCHPLPLDFVGVDAVLGDDHVSLTVTVKAVYKTGVEMEALTAASVAGLTVYDMLKMFSMPMKMEVQLLRKTGGKSDFEALPETLDG